MATKKKDPQVNGESLTINIPRINVQTVRLEVVGISPLVVCNWSQKAMQMMLDKQMKKPNQGRNAKNPEEDYKASLYTSTEGWTGVPAHGVKAGLVNACRMVDGLPMTMAKRILYVPPQGYTDSNSGLVRIHGEHKMWENHTRLESGVADIRFRAMYEKWSALFEIEFIQNQISAEQVANLVELCGRCEGWCEWRPGSPKSNSGTFGMFEVKRMPK